MNNNQWLKFTGLFLISLFAADIVSAQTNDSIVSWEADFAGLSVLSPSDIPARGGTFWLVSSNNLVGAPFPCAPPGVEADNTYALPNGTYLVDGTAGGNGVSGPQMVKQMNAVSNLIVQAQVQATAMTSRAMGMRAMNDSGGLLPPGAGDGGTNDYTPNDVTYTPPDYGTNLYIAQWSVVSNSLTGIASNTLAGVIYEIQTNSDLTTTNWSVSQIISGSETTNWTTLILPPPNLTNNLFFRLRSDQSSDGSGLPDWWEQEYFGTTGIDPYGDPAGDGWSNLQKYENGWNPTNFYTPAAPQGLTATMNPSNSVVTLAWLPAQGVVTGYTIYRFDYATFSETSYHVGVTNQLVDTSYPAYSDLTQPSYYNVQANYAAGNSQWSPNVSPYSLIATPIVQNFPGPLGSTVLLLTQIPAGVASIRVIRNDVNEYTDVGTATNMVFPVSDFTNGAFTLPSSLLQPLPYPISTSFSVQAVWPDGSRSTRVGIPDAGWPMPLYFDGRTQLAQNAAFLLRSASLAGPLTYGVDDDLILQPTNYAYASYYNPNYYSSPEVIGDGSYADWSRPFVENNRYRNFVLSATNVDASGFLNTGYSWQAYDLSGDWSEYAYYPTLTDPLTFIFSAPTNNNATVPALLPASQTASVLAYYNAGDLGIYTNGSGQFALPGNIYNYFGLHLPSVLVAHQDGSTLYFNTLSAGGTFPQTNGDTYYFYPQFDQPNLSTVGYYFGRMGNWWDNYASVGDPLPGNNRFSPTNAQPLLIAGVGYPLQFAAFANQTILDGDTTKPVYVAQYFDKAYKVDTNGNVTVNQTGILSSWGDFYPTDLGTVALVTLPDIDTGARGTGIVHCISLQVDKNHDGIMDLSFNGADATSKNSPMVFWINNDNDGTSIGQDIDAPKFPDSANETIQSMRDLEDFARLWICGMPSIDPTLGYQVTLSWTSVSRGSPSVKIFPSRETNGGTAYLTDTNDAQSYVGNPLTEPCFGTVANGGTLNLPDFFFLNTGNKYLMFEGVSAGAGELVLTILQNGNTIAKTGVWLDLHDVKDLYEQAQATNVTSSLPPSSLVSQLQVIKTVAVSSDETKQIIIFVHGINNTAFEAQNSTETIFKRLYWSGYHGKVAEFKWPCAFLPNNLANPADYLRAFNFDKGEFYAWKSASAFKDYLNYLENRPDLANYQIDILAHSQGNIVASEALEQGAPFDNYILTQGAVPAHCYDVSVPFQQKFLDAETNAPTPLYTTNGGYHGYFANLTGNLINFYNTNDYALRTGNLLGLYDVNWEKDQISQKPENYDYLLSFGQTYYYHPSAGNSVAYYAFSDYVVTDMQETKAMVARSRTHAVGAQENVGEAMKTSAQIDLFNTFKFGNTRDDHSAQFAWPIQRVWGYYDEVLSSYGIQPITR